MVHTCFSSQQLGRGRWICESKASLIYTLSSKASQGFLKENQKPNKNNVVWEYKLEGLGLPGRLGHGSPKSSCQGSYQLSQCQRKGLPAPSGARGWGGMCVYVWGRGSTWSRRGLKDQTLPQVGRAPRSRSAARWSLWLGREAALEASFQSPRCHCQSLVPAKLPVSTQLRSQVRIFRM